MLWNIDIGHNGVGGATAPPGTFHQGKTHQNRASLKKILGNIFQDLTASYAFINKPAI